MHTNILGSGLDRPSGYQNVDPLLASASLGFRGFGLKGVQNPSKPKNGSGFSLQLLTPQGLLGF